MEHLLRQDRHLRVKRLTLSDLDSIVLALVFVLGALLSSLNETYVISDYGRNDWGSRFELSVRDRNHMCMCTSVEFVLVEL